MHFKHVLSKRIFILLSMKILIHFLFSNNAAGESETPFFLLIRIEYRSAWQKRRIFSTYNYTSLTGYLFTFHESRSFLHFASLLMLFCSKENYSDSKHA